MPVPTFTKMGPYPEFQDVVNKVNTLVAELQNLMVSLDTLNIIKLNAKVIEAGTITAEKIGAHEITADKMNVSELSAISANLGTITAGSVTTDAEINVGTDARIGNILYLKASDSSGQKGVIFNNVGSIVAEIQVLSGDMSIDASGFIAINPGSSMGVVVNGNLSANSIKKGVTDVAMSGSSTSTHIQPNHNHGIPDGAQLLGADGVTVYTFSASGGFSHSHTQNS